MKITDNVHRVDSSDKLKGKAVYIEDWKPDDILYAKTLRSTEACSKIVSIHYPPLPEGVYIVDVRDIIDRNEVAMITTDMPVFAYEKVTYVGEPIALIVSENKDKIVEYMKHIEVAYAPEQPVFTMQEAQSLEGYTYTEHNFTKGSLDQIKADLVFTEKFETPYQEQLYMEKQGVVGTFEDGVITVYGSLQCPYYVLNALKHTTGMDETKVRVIQTTTGGAFGGKEEYPSIIACQIATAAYKFKRPVQLVFDRREDIAYTTKRHPSESIMTSYVKDGKIIGMEMDIVMDAGSYIGLSDVVLQRAILTMTGCYDIPNLKVKGRTLKTNNVFTGAFRGFGAPQSMYALELHISHLAAKLKMDQLEFRQKHFVNQGGLTATEGIFNEEIYLEDMVEKLKSISGYPTRLDTPNKWTGYGISAIPHGGGFTGDGEATHIKAVVKLRKEENGTVTILVSNVEMGQGAITTLTKIVASVLELPMGRVKYEVPDTFKVPDSGPTVASRTTMVVGRLIAIAAKNLKPYMDQPGEHTITEHFVKPDYVKWNQETFKGNAYMAYSWSILLARVEVDPITYEVDCTDIWGVYDVGIPIDEKLLLGQVHGGIVQGLGYALMEHMTSEEGHIEQIAFSSYPIPTSMDIPKMHADWIINRYVDGPFGAKAAGELTLVGVAPAISAAVEDAIGKWTNIIPVTPEIIERILR